MEWEVIFLKTMIGVMLLALLGMSIWMMKDIIYVVFGDFIERARMINKVRAQWEKPKNEKND